MTSTSNHQLKKMISSDLGGASANCKTLNLPEDLWTEEPPTSELYPEALPPVALKKHSTDFLQNRRKVQHLAESRLAHLSEELSKLADEVRYYHPLIAELLDEAWDATEEAMFLINEA